MVFWCFPMKITNISTAVLESNFDWTFIKIETDEKISGYGESFWDQVSPPRFVSLDRF